MYGGAVSNLFASLASKIIAALVALALLGGAVAYHFYVVAGLNGTVSKLTTDNAGLKSANDKLQSANQDFARLTVDQNKAIQALQDAAEQRAKDVAAAQTAAAQAAATGYAAAQVTATRPMPKSNDECGSLDVLLNEAAARKSK